MMGRSMFDFMDERAQAEATSNVERRKRGIGDATYEQLKPDLALSGATTLTEKVKLPRAPRARPISDATRRAFPDVTMVSASTTSRFWS